MELKGEHAFIKETNEGCLLFLKVIPRSYKSQIIGIENESLRLRLKASPVDGAANEALVEFLGELFNCSKNHFNILRGQHSKHKVIRINGIKRNNLLEILKNIKD